MSRIRLLSKLSLFFTTITVITICTSFNEAPLVKQVYAIEFEKEEQPVIGKFEMSRNEFNKLHSVLQDAAMSQHGVCATSLTNMPALATGVLSSLPVESIITQIEESIATDVLPQIKFSENPVLRSEQQQLVADVNASISELKSKLIKLQVSLRHTQGISTTSMQEDWEKLLERLSTPGCDDDGDSKPVLQLMRFAGLDVQKAAMIIDGLQEFLVAMEQNGLVKVAEEISISQKDNQFYVNDKLVDRKLVNEYLSQFPSIQTTITITAVGR